jgi:small-conductance mechanosensitive channel
VRPTPWVAIPASLIAVLVLARLARLRPVLKPLVLPVAVTAFVACFVLFLGVPGPRVAFLAVALPLLVVLVRGSVLVLEVVFRRSQGAPPPELLASVVSFLLYGFGAGLIAHTWFGFELTPFLSTSAVVGAVFGLALQETLGNLFAGIALHAEAPFRVGDWVRSGGTEGQIHQVSWRATRLRTRDGDTLTIPNSEVARHPILNYSVPARPHSRVVSVGAGAQTPPNRVSAVLRGVLREVHLVCRDPPPQVRVSGFHDTSVQYEIRYSISSHEEHPAVEGEILRLVWYHFHRHGITIPSPSQEIFLHTMPPGPEVETPASRLEATLRSIDLFRPLDDEGLRMAAGRFRRLHYAAGERIIAEGSSGDSFFVIDRGEVEVFRDIGSARRQIAQLAEGQFFGEMALLTGEGRSAAVAAITDVDLFTIDKAGFHDVLLAHPSIAEDISTILSERREGLAQTGDAPEASGDSEATPTEFKQRILDRIRSYFGL